MKVKRLNFLFHTMLSCEGCESSNIPLLWKWEDFRRSCMRKEAESKFTRMTNALFCQQKGEEEDIWPESEEEEEGQRRPGPGKQGRRG